VKPNHASLRPVGVLHERIYQLYDSEGWFVFQQLYHEAAGLHPADTSNAVSDAMPAAPLDCSALEPGLVEAISQAPARVARWMLYEPPEPPRWRVPLELLVAIVVVTHPWPVSTG
jgi:hypothetical protein